MSIAATVRLLPFYLAESLDLLVQKEHLTNNGNYANVDSMETNKQLKQVHVSLVVHFIYISLPEVMVKLRSVILPAGFGAFLTLAKIKLDE